MHQLQPPEPTSSRLISWKPAVSKTFPAGKVASRWQTLSSGDRRQQTGAVSAASVSTSPRGWITLPCTVGMVNGDTAGTWAAGNFCCCSELPRFCWGRKLWHSHFLGHHQLVGVWCVRLNSSKIWGNYTQVFEASGGFWTWFHVEEFMEDVRIERIVLPEALPEKDSQFCRRDLEENSCSFNSFQRRTVVYNRRNWLAAFNLELRFPWWQRREFTLPRFYLS